MLPVPVSAQDAVSTDRDIWAAVGGLSSGDLLNVRAEASPLGRTVGRLPNGTMVRKLECGLFDGYEWCRVDSPEVEDLTGWAPARYLASQEDGGGEPALAVEAPAAEAADRDARLAAEAESALPPGLEDRFAGGSARPIDEVRAQESRVPQTADAVVNEAPGGPARAEPGEAQQAAAPGYPQQGTPAPGIPVPSPRPGAAEVDQGESPSATAAQASPSGAASPVGEGSAPAMPDAGAQPGRLADEIPCARYSGQPMVRCAVRVVRTGDEAAEVTVVWPDGGTRVITFRNGTPSGSNSRGDLRYTREGTLNMIRIGVSERFEILDALAFED